MVALSISAAPGQGFARSCQLLASPVVLPGRCLSASLCYFLVACLRECWTRSLSGAFEGFFPPNPWVILASSEQLSPSPHYVANEGFLFLSLISLVIGPYISNALLLSAFRYSRSYEPYPVFRGCYCLALPGTDISSFPFLSLYSFSPWRSSLPGVTFRKLLL